MKGKKVVTSMVVELLRAEQIQIRAVIVDFVVVELVRPEQIQIRLAIVELVVVDDVKDGKLSSTAFIFFVGQYVKDKRTTILNHPKM